MPRNPTRPCCRVGTYEWAGTSSECTDYHTYRSCLTLGSVAPDGGLGVREELPEAIAFMRTSEGVAREPRSAPRTTAFSRSVRGEYSCFSAGFSSGIGDRGGLSMVLETVRDEVASPRNGNRWGPTCVPTSYRLDRTLSNPRLHTSPRQTRDKSFRRGSYRGYKGFGSLLTDTFQRCRD